MADVRTLPDAQTAPEAPPSPQHVTNAATIIARPIGWSPKYGWNSTSIRSGRASAPRCRSSGTGIMTGRWSSMEAT